MAKEQTILSLTKELGFTPMEGNTIVVSYTSKDLSGKIREFFNFNTENFILQLCEGELVLLPIEKNWMVLSPADMYRATKDTELVLSYHDIEAIEVIESLLNYDIRITTNDGVIQLTTQQKGLSDFRKSGQIATKPGLNIKGESWHADNVDTTLATLAAIK